MFCLHQLPSVDADEFSRYWREEHAPLFKQYADALAVRRYV
ncbi:MAG: Ethyl tert-butyl ether degradation protein EthD [Pseudonocardiales bacterium]|nr:Ethyl tert-butyl ether degradation protein EthD [Pseudonocardiales bacterium]